MQLVILQRVLEKSFVYGEREDTLLSNRKLDVFFWRRLFYLFFLVDDSFVLQLFSCFSKFNLYRLLIRHG